jgi:beta-glucanase (GH16 family)
LKLAVGLLLGALMLAGPLLQSAESREAGAAAVQDTSTGSFLLLDPGAVAWAVNVGGEEHRGIDAIAFSADQHVSGGEAGRLPDVVGAQDPAVYRSYRKGNLRIRKPLASGRYDLTFLFAEPEDIPVGERVFDVTVQGRKAIASLDIRAARDDRFHAALSRTVVDVQVTGGTLAIDLDPVNGVPVLSGLVVRERRPSPRNWRLAWADEFDYDGPPDPGSWNIQVWDARKVNDEAQAYTARHANVRVEGGRLVLEAHREGYGEADYTSGRIHSAGKVDLLYGRVDFRARVPTGQGTWSALWMLPSDPFRYATNCEPGIEWQGNPACDAWPNSGEIDIMEHVGYDDQRVHGTVHNNAYYTVNWQHRKGAVEVRDVHRDFHVYSLVWTPQRLDMFYDGSLYFTYHNEGHGWEAWPYDHHFHMILNLAIGGYWGRAGGPIDDSIFPVSMEVDYVRVFEDAEPASAPITPGEAAGTSGAAR